LHFPHVGAVYISTEDVFPSKRLHQLTQCFAKNQASHPSAVKINFSDNVFIEHAADVVSPKINQSIEYHGFRDILSELQLVSECYLQCIESEAYAYTLYDSDRMEC